MELESSGSLKGKEGCIMRRSGMDVEWSKQEILNNLTSQLVNVGRVFFSSRYDVEVNATEMCETCMENK